MKLQLHDSETSITVSEHIRFCKVHGRVILIDLYEEDYLILDESATFLWGFIGGNLLEEEVIKIFADKFNICYEEAKKDCTDFFLNCISKKILTTNAILQKSDDILIKKSISLLNAWLSLFQIRKLLKKRGFAEVYLKISRLKFAGIKPESSPHKILQKALQIFQLAENGISIRTAERDCLPRSIALYKFLLAGGIHVNHCIGVRRFPFGAHAWVEVENKPVYDSPEFVKQFSVIAKISSCKNF